MNSIWPQLSYRKLAHAYGATSAQRLQQVARDHGRELLMQPHKLAKAMLEKKPKTLLQQLQNPHEIRRIRQELKTMTETTTN